MFHAGDGNLHPLILFDANVEPSAIERAEAFGAAILELCIEVGGTVTGEHGVGVEKLPQMCVQFRAGRARALSRGQGGVRPAVACSIRARRVPTLSRCAEFGKMHVHHGELPHPELPRF